jgi:hypothetical protein
MSNWQTTPLLSSPQFEGKKRKYFRVLLVPLPLDVRGRGKEIGSMRERR